ncbi:SGNH/GDSL hydrolase family protein [Joostella atrarenae]|uniref:SGNH/GDSL hydrolase family protein n=1 Tax=Joostella atrarenae TaxID=679257 RepID=A0ABS9J487_9FLAO|nr:SGNH/GDSL hydrolase family protein [Joostella atrarenae]MCF8715204.1 SGNH/GDSL hydrolase family protein [Joostella atrarenae]
MKKHFLMICLFSAVYSFGQQTAVEFANFAKYEAENKALPAPKASEDRVVFMGNSITEGWKNNHPEFFENNPYIDRGISGQTTSQMLLRFRRDVIDLKPKAVTFLAGINDIAENTGPIEIKDVFGNIISMVELAQQNNIVPIICATLPANHFPWRERIQPATKVIELNEMLKAYAKKNNIVYVDYYKAMVDDKMGLSEELASDGVHPTSKGYDIMEPLVKKGIEEALKN